MLRLMKSTIVAGLLAACFLLVSAETAQAQRGYWDNYWNWYDNSYSPYYRYRYRYTPRGYNYSYTYRYPSYGNYYGTYNYPGYSTYYRSPGNYYYGGYPSVGVQLGPLRIQGWY